MIKWSAAFIIIVLLLGFFLCSAPFVIVVRHSSGAPTDSMTVSAVPLVKVEWPK